MMARKEQVVEELTDNVRKLLEGNKVDIINGIGRLVGENEVEVVKKPGSRRKSDRQILKTKAVLLATGSEPLAVPGLEFDGERIVSSTEALTFDSVPTHLAIVGGGYIGLELGSVWLRLGSKVTTIEMLPQIATLLDGQIARGLERILAKQGLTFRLQTKVSGAKVSGKQVQVSLEKDGKKETMNCDRLLVAVGRRPLTRDLGLEEIGVELDARTGHVLVDEQFQTNVKSIYAIGDLIPGPALAHTAS